MISDDEAVAVATPLPPAERQAYLARICAGNPTRRVHLAARLRDHDAAQKNGAPERNMNDVPSTALLRMLTGQVRRFVFFVVTLAAGEAGGMLAGGSAAADLIQLLPALPPLTTFALGMALLVAFVVHLWFEKRRPLLFWVFLIAVAHGYLIKVT